MKGEPCVFKPERASATFIIARRAPLDGTLRTLAFLVVMTAVRGKGRVGGARLPPFCKKRKDELLALLLPTPRNSHWGTAPDTTSTVGCISSYSSTSWLPVGRTAGVKPVLSTPMPGLPRGA
jgi:hypothetical protein